MTSRMTKHYALYMKIFTEPSTQLFTGSSTFPGFIFAPGINKHGLQISKIIKPKTRTNYFQKGNYAFNISKL